MRYIDGYPTPPTISEFYKRLQDTPYYKAVKRWEYDLGFEGAVFYLLEREDLHGVEINRLLNPSDEGNVLDLFYGIEIY